MLELLQYHSPTVVYVVLFLSACVEGESVVLTASSLAYSGYLSLPHVIGVTLAATVLADQLLFHVGRIYGPRLLMKRPKLKKKSAYILKMLKKYNVVFILVFRFIYGIRTVSPLILGTSDLSTRRFTILNVVSALIWTVISCYGGYAILGRVLAYNPDILTSVIDHLRSQWVYFISILVVLLGFYYVLRLYLSIRKK